MNIAAVNSPQHQLEEAFELYGWPGQGRLVITCEHASNRLPDSFKPDPDDLPWLETHWSYDIGARDVTLGLIQETNSAGILSRYSRLVADPNKSPDDPAIICSKVEHHILSFNELLSPESKRRRIEKFHKPFHDAVDSLLRLRLPHGGDILLISLHTFVPALYGLHKQLDVGILFHPYQSVATRLSEEFEKLGLKTALNEPHSGRRGHIYSASRHGLKNQIIFLELEVNQVLLTTAPKTSELVVKLAKGLENLNLRRSNR